MDTKSSILKRRRLLGAFKAISSARNASFLSKPRRIHPELGAHASSLLLLPPHCAAARALYMLYTTICNGPLTESDRVLEASTCIRGHRFLDYTMLFPTESMLPSLCPVRPVPCSLQLSSSKSCTNWSRLKPTLQRGGSCLRTIAWQSWPCALLWSYVLPKLPPHLWPIRLLVSTRLLCDRPIWTRL
jgi:hypothetical protein